MAAKRVENFNSRRRAFLETSASAAVGLLVGQYRTSATQRTAYRAVLSDCSHDPFTGGQPLGFVPLDDLDAPDVPFHRLVGEGLDARLFTDLSKLTADSLVTTNDRFFVRTARPRAVDRVQKWQIDVGGLVERPRTLSVDELRRGAAPMGTHLIECAGNARGGRFGLMSMASWSGFPLAPLIEDASPRSSATHVLVTGIDDPDSAVTSTAGASWMFSRGDLAHAFLATGMNGEALPPDHGAPVRLIVPGWYGCACIKWVTGITLADDSAPATGQMKEFAARTHQAGVPALAREYVPATIDFAAMPVRVEKWRLNSRVAYLIVGIAWGGQTGAPRLLIRINPREPFVPVNGCPPLGAAPLRDSWRMWTHVWTPPATGRYQLVLKAGDADLRTRRLDLYYYTRTVRIDEV